MSIKVSNVTKYFGSQKALDDISFSISKGSIAGFIGPNGAGKTTTMRIITGYLRADKGRVWVDGLDIEQNPLEVRRKIGYLAENNPLYYDMYVLDFLKFVGEIYKVQNLKQRIAEVVEITGLEPEKHKKIGQLSKGFKQRVGLAQAIIHDPEVLILDEPTSGLDPNQIVEIRNLIKELGKHKTVMLSTHIMQEVEAICDQIIIINKGRIVASGTPEEINQYVAKRLNFVVEFNKPIEQEKLYEIDGVLEVHYVRGNLWILQSDSDIREHIFNFAVSNNLVVLSLEMERMSLEEIFQMLTKK